MFAGRGADSRAVRMCGGVCVGRVRCTLGLPPSGASLMAVFLFLPAFPPLSPLPPSLSVSPSLLSTNSTIRRRRVSAPPCWRPAAAAWLAWAVDADQPRVLLALKRMTAVLMHACLATLLAIVAQAPAPSLVMAYWL